MTGTDRMAQGSDLPLDQKVNILLVDDQPANLLVLEAILDDLQQNLVKATSGEEALRQLMEKDFAAILLDVQMHGLDGFQTAKYIRSRDRSRHTPIIFITAFESDEFPIEQAYSLGAVDYLVKPLVPTILRAKVAGLVEIYQKGMRLRLLERREFERKLTEEADRSHALQAQADEQAYFQAHLLDAVDQAVIATDPAGMVTYWNRFAENMYGWSREEALGKTIVDLVVPPSSMGQAGEIMQRLALGESWTGEFRVRHRSGHEFPVMITDTPIFDRHGNLHSLVGISVDISKQKQVEETLRLLAEASATLAAIVDSESTLQRVADLVVPRLADCCSIYLLQPDGTLHCSAVSHVEPEKTGLMRELAARYLSRPHPSQGPCHVARTSQSEFMEEIFDWQLVQAAQDPQHLQQLREANFKSYMCVPLRMRDANLGVLSFVTSSSGRMFTQADLALAEELGRRAAIAIENCKLYAGLREADRRKDEFLAMLAHELRNPLAPIRNAVHVLTMPNAEPSVIARMREIAERQVQHMARLLDDLLDMSRISRGRIELRNELLDVASLVQRTVEGTRPLLEERKHQLEIELPPELLLVNGDPTRLEQVLTNLLNNAIKYTDPEGRIVLQVRKTDGWIELRVRDSGIGIAPDMLPHIFDLFVQAERRLDRARGGVGIGLTLVRRLVELHGGEVTVSSPGLGAGSEFVVRLPAVGENLSALESLERTGPTTAEVLHRRILVVDDNQDAAESLAMLLKLSGQRVQTAYSGAAALETIQAEPPDMIFLDIGMPGMDGYEVARLVRQLPGLASVQLIALTGWGQEEDRRRTQEAGFNHHLVKPVEPVALRNLLSTKS